MTEFKILYEDEEIMVVIKPPNMPSQKDFSGDLDMLSAVERKLKKPIYSDENFAYLIHRLDRPVGGIMVFAKTETACTNLSKQLQGKEMSKLYLAIVCNKPKEEQATLTDYILKKTNNVSVIVPKGTLLSKKAILSYQVIDTLNDDAKGTLSLLQIQLMTGRHHQIRVQLSHAGIPIYGDTKYNQACTPGSGWHQIALFANQLSFVHPKKKELMKFEAKPDYVPFSNWRNYE